MHQRQNPWRVLVIAVQVGALALAATATMAQLGPIKVEEPPSGNDSLVNTNERIRFDPPVCRAIKFVPGSTLLTRSAIGVIPVMHETWRTAPSERNNVVLVVRPDAGLASAEARRQAQLRASVLSRALVQSGIDRADVFVYPQSARASRMALSCPPIGSAR